MMNEENLLQTTTLNETEIFGLLKSSLYIGAKDDSIKLVLNYCKAAGLDPMQKPVHIVPMNCSTGRKNEQGYEIKEYRDVIMPGIGLYRTQASRSGEYAGVSEPEFGEEVTEEINDKTFTYPKWCKVTVKRLLKNGELAEFTALELWKENYATKNKDTLLPNAMWMKRPYGQIAKCTEAQGLRRAFPELGSAPTADEMEGKDIIDITPQPNTVSNTESNTESKANETGLPLPCEVDDASFVKKSVIWKQTMISNGSTAEELIDFLQARYILTESQKNIIKMWDKAA